jgi:hypothetical protein
MAEQAAGRSRGHEIRKTTDCIGRRMAGRYTLIGLALRRLRCRYGVVLHGRTNGSTVRFDDRGELDLAAVVGATEFRVDYSWINVPVFDPSGRVVHSAA